MKSEFLTVNQKDLLRSALLLVLSTIAMGVVKILEKEGFNLSFQDIKEIVSTGLVTGLVYLGKNLLTNSKDQGLKKEIR